jgi:hypothetical protein
MIQWFILILNQVKAIAGVGEWPTVPHLLAAGL